MEDGVGIEKTKRESTPDTDTADPGVLLSGRDSTSHVAIQILETFIRSLDEVYY